MNYKEIVNNTVIPGTLSNAEKEVRYTQLGKHITSLFPKRLYRYRCCSERHLSAFYKDELWFSNGSAMNDDFDARLYYNRKVIQERLRDLRLENRGKDFISTVIDIDKLPQNVALVPGMVEFFSSIKQMPIAQIYSNYDHAVQWLLESTDSALVNITNQVQRSIKFACFSETYKSDLMWGHYSSSATGFVLEYMFDRQSYECSREAYGIVALEWYNLFPVIYDNNRLDTTEYVWFLFLRTLMSRVANTKGVVIPTQWFDSNFPCPDEFMSTKLALVKSKEWKPEKEWRMFLVSENPGLNNEKFSQVICKPRAVYLGRKISELNEKIILDIAKEKNIPAYKMVFNDRSRNYQLKARKIL
ncbi:MAG: DUF2971 domain-containing protein [Anaerovibrio sp.]|uniref:DUF2971 domain-containing protein n=1 Tax=Anaerovibrio sp. TaxID=1872532 RepID=UPI0025C3C8FC|nr:DUF2971 domain-containing protein [Anaerovibrio sp.]MBE6099307.1 DUF2971 domain-containing protein [Anaerovibrio sp.]